MTFFTNANALKSEELPHQTWGIYEKYIRLSLEDQTLHQIAPFLLLLISMARPKDSRRAVQAFKPYA